MFSKLMHASFTCIALRRVLKSRFHASRYSSGDSASIARSTITALEKEVAALPKHIAVIEKALESHLRKLEADKAALTANQKDRKQLEGDIQMHEQKISKLRDQMLGAKTNEQYRAFQHEIEFIEKEIRKAEDRILELMTESEPLDAERQEGRGRAEARKSRWWRREKTKARERTAADQAELDHTQAGTRGNRGQAPPPARPLPPTNAFARSGRRVVVAEADRRPLLRLPDRPASAIPPGL